MERDKCAKGGLVSASGLCPRNQANGVECCFERKLIYLPLLLLLRAINKLILLIN